MKMGHALRVGVDWHNYSLALRKTLNMSQINCACNSRSITPSILVPTTT